jgi:hypothetical protein
MNELLLLGGQLLNATQVKIAIYSNWNHIKPLRGHVAPVVSLFNFKNKLLN